MRLAVAGAAGRMGRTLARIIHETPGVTLGGGLERSGSEFVGRDFGELAGLGILNVPLTDQAPELFTRIDGIIDFTIPAASVDATRQTSNPPPQCEGGRTRRKRRSCHP